MTDRSPQMLLSLLELKTVVEFEEIRSVIGGASRATAFRYLKQVPYRRSYNHNGRYYTLHDQTRYDRFGLFSHGDIHFSRDGTLRATVTRMVQEAVAGWTQRELRELLRVRVQPFLLAALRAGEIDREFVEQFYVYLHIDYAVKETQLQRREEKIALNNAAQQGQIEPADHVVIQVLLTLLHYPGSKPAQVVRRLRGHSPPISLQKVHAVFSRYDLDNIGKKKGASTY